MGRVIITFIFLIFTAVVSDCAVLDNKIWLASLSSFERGLPVTTGAGDKFNTTSNILFISSAVTFNEYLRAEITASAGQYYHENLEEKDNKISAAVNALSVTLGPSGYYIRAGRQFYGRQNTLRPYYGLYENYFGVSSSSLDGVYAAVNIGGGVSADFIYGGETENNFSYSKGGLCGASANIPALRGIFELEPFVYNYRGREHYLDKDLWLYGASLTVNFKTDASLYVSYAANGGGAKEKFSGDQLKTTCGAWLVKFNSASESKYFDYKMRFLYLRSDGPGEDGRTFEGVHPYIYLGSVFTGSNLFKDTLGSSTKHYPGGADNLTAYNIGLTAAPAFARFIKFDFDVYSYAETYSPGVNPSIGSEMDLGLTVTPWKHLDITLVYAKFYPGEGFKAQFSSLAVEDITQIALKAILKF